MFPIRPRRVVRRAAMAVVIVVLVGCTRSSPRVKIILPNGFTGVAEIQQSPDASVPVTDESGALVYRIEKQGTLSVPSLQPLMNWHEQIVQYEDGTLITNEREAPPDTVAVRESESVDNTVRFRIDTIRQ